VYPLNQLDVHYNKLSMSANSMIMAHVIRYNHKLNQFHNNGTKNNRLGLVVLTLIKLFIDSWWWMLKVKSRRLHHDDLPWKNEINGTLFEYINYFALNIVNCSFVLAWIHMIICFHLWYKTLFYKWLALIMIYSDKYE